MEEKVRQVTCPACNGSKGHAPDEPCERCDGIGKVDARTLEAIAADLRRSLNASRAADMKAKRHEEQQAEAERDRLEHDGEVKQLQRELLYTLEDDPEPVPA